MYIYIHTRCHEYNIHTLHKYNVNIHRHDITKHTIHIYIPWRHLFHWLHCNSLWQSLVSFFLVVETRVGEQVHWECKLKPAKAFVSTWDASLTDGWEWILPKLLKLLKKTDEWWWMFLSELGDTPSVPTTRYQIAHMYSEWYFSLGTHTQSACIDFQTT